MSKDVSLRTRGPAWCEGCGRPRSLACSGCVDAAREIVSKQAGARTAESTKRSRANLVSTRAVERKAKERRPVPA